MRVPALVALTPGGAEPAGVPALVEAAARARAAGLDALLVREHRLADRELLELVRSLRRLFAAGDGAWLGVHDRVHLALLGEADAVHLGFRSLPPDVARRIAGDRLAVGLSTHADDDPSGWAAADYLFHGPVRETPSKQGLKEPVGFGGLAAAARRAAVPVLAIGGMRPEDVGPALAAGARGVAVLGGILGARDPGAAAEAYLEALARVARGP